ncbi:uncharacterized protein V1510DRAFT_418917 [Dipodascopsis tothii]|uniref:uncharacterized protein n=1 Tax=Dipodascopsis tothii TaxID=44089 RepID=UPI0034CF7E0B
MFIRHLQRTTFGSGMLAPMADAGVPDSKEASAVLERAKQNMQRQKAIIDGQNEILKAVGIGMSRDEIAERNNKRARREESEHYFGSKMITVAVFLSDVVMWPMAELLERLQVYRTRPDISYFEILRGTLRTKSLPSLYASLTTTTLRDLINSNLRAFAHAGLNRLTARTRLRDHPHVVEGLRMAVEVGSWVITYPLSEYEVLQALHIEPPRLVPPLAVWLRILQPWKLLPNLPHVLEVAIVGVCSIKAVDLTGAAASQLLTRQSDNLFHMAMDCIDRNLLCYAAYVVSSSILGSPAFRSIAIHHGVTTAYMPGEIGNWRVVMRAATANIFFYGAVSTAVAVLGDLVSGVLFPKTL